MVTEKQLANESDWYQEGHNVVIKFARENLMSGEQPTSNRHDTDMWVAMTLPDKSKSKSQGYVITEKGKNMN